MRGFLAEPQLSRACCVAFAADIEAAIRSFLDDLPKPISAGDFLAAMDRLIARRRDTQNGWAS